MKDHHLTIGHWDVNYLVASQDAPPVLDERWRTVMQSEIVRACADHLSSHVAETDRSVWLIRALKLDFSGVGSSSVWASAAKSWGSQLAGAIQQTTLAGDEEGLVLHFDSRAAYLAQLIRDLASGSASSKWYYQEFASLFSLPANRAICEALIAEPEEVGAVMVELLALGGLTQTLVLLNQSDAQDLFESWKRAWATAEPDDEWVGPLLELWSETPFREPAPGVQPNPYRDALWGAALAISRYPAADGDGAMLATVHSLLEVRAVLSKLSFETRERLLECLAWGDFAGVARMAPDSLHHLERFARSMSSDRDWARQVQGVLLGEQEYIRASSSPRIISRGPAIPSASGGLFRLGPSFVARGAAALSPAARLCVALKCLGSDRGPHAIADEVARLFAGYQGDALEAVLIPPPESDRPCGPYWFLEHIDLPRKAVVLRDIIEDEWVWAAPGDETAEERAKAVAASHGAELIQLNDGGSEDLARRINIPVRRVVRGMRPITEEFAWFTLPESIAAIDPATEIAGTLFARAVLKHFARRLIAFDLSSPEHLLQNCLAGTAFVRDTSDRIEVELPPPPLAIVLSMAGILEEAYTLPWIDGRTICLLRSA